MHLLSVCIPTYKRPETLQRSIGSVAEQIEKFDLADVVTIYVANDSSPDSTREVLDSYGDKKYLKHISRSDNLGMNRNIKKMLGEAAEFSEYQLIITDDDYLQPDILNEIVNFLHKMQGDGNRVPVIWTPRYSYTEDGELHCVVCNSFDASQSVEPSAANAGRHMFNGFVLSGLMLKADNIDYDFWEKYRENAYFPVIFFGELISRRGAYYWDRNIVHHTVLNECHWENWGKNEILINLRLFSDYLIAYSFMARKLNRLSRILPFYLFSWPSIFDEVRSFMLSDNLKGDKALFFEAVGEQKRNGHLNFNAAVLLLLILSLPLNLLVSLFKIIVTRFQLLVTHKEELIIRFHNRMAINKSIIGASPAMFRFLFSLLTRH